MGLPGLKGGGNVGGKRTELF